MKRLIENLNVRVLSLTVASLQAVHLTTCWSCLSAISTVAWHTRQVTKFPEGSDTHSSVLSEVVPPSTEMETGISIDQ